MSPDINASWSTKGRTMVSLLEERAVSTPDRPFIVMDEGNSRSFGAFNSDANRLAHGLAGLGVEFGDHVAVMITNRLEGLLVSFALRKLGAVEISVHTRTRGAGLLHVLEVSRPKLMVVQEDLVDRLGDLGADLPPFDILVLGDVDVAEQAVPGRRLTPYGVVVTEQEDNPGISFQDTHLDAVLFTSGTTGAAKGCMLSHRAGSTCGLGIARALKFREDDVLYCPYPASHVDSRYMTVAPALWIGARAAIGRRFSVSRFWDEVRLFEATVFDFMGSTLTMLWNQEPHESDLDNPVRLAWGVPLPSIAPLFSERFGLTVTTGFGQTDAGSPVWRDPDLRNEPFNSCGRVVDPYELRIGDEHDDPVPTGEIGEILFRSHEADVMMKGYLGMPEKTAEVFRNQWLHTGDYGRLDADGRLYFEGRKVESIRRRGENISSWEVEQALQSHPEIREAVAVGVPSDLGEEDVCAYLVLQDGSELTKDSLDHFLKPKLADFMVPQIVKVVSAIPKTDTDKPEKFRLTQAGVPGQRVL